MKSKGRSKMQMGAARPCDTATTPNSPTSVAVSNPSPNKNPTINMCRGFEIAWNSRGQHLNHKPIVASWLWSPAWPFHSIHSCRAVHKLRIPRGKQETCRNRKAKDSAICMERAEHVLHETLRHQDAAASKENHKRMPKSKEPRSQ